MLSKAPWLNQKSNEASWLLYVRKRSVAINNKVITIHHWPVGELLAVW